MKRRHPLKGLPKRDQYLEKYPYIYIERERESRIYATATKCRHALKQARMLKVSSAMVASVPATGTFPVDAKPETVPKQP